MGALESASGIVVSGALHLQLATSFGVFFVMGSPLDQAPHAQAMLGVLSEQVVRLSQSRSPWSVEGPAPPESRFPTAARGRE